MAAFHAAIPGSVPDTKDEARLASRTKGEHRNSSPYMPAFRTFSSTPAPPFLPTSED